MNTPRESFFQEENNPIDFTKECLQQQEQLLELVRQPEPVYYHDEEIDCFENVIRNNAWLDEIAGLVPHCLAILKTCRFLTERMTTLTISVISVNNGLVLKKIVDVKTF